MVIQHYREKRCISISARDEWDGSLTFGPFQQVDLQDRLGWRLPPSDQQPHHWPRLLQGLHRPTVNHLGHVHFVHPQHAVVHAAEGGGGTFLVTDIHRTLSGGKERTLCHDYFIFLALVLQ